jgi:hypothetical protein
MSSKKPGKNTLPEECLRLKTHLQNLLMIELQKAFKNGLEKLPVKDIETHIKLKTISEHAAKNNIKTDDVYFIVNEVIPKDPSAGFIKKYEALYVLIEKYRAINDIIANIDDIKKLKKSYRIHFRALDKNADTDSVTKNFLNQFEGRFGGNDRFFPAVEGLEKLVHTNPVIYYKRH